MRPGDRRHSVLVPATAFLVVVGLLSCSSNRGSPTPTSSGGSPTSQPSASSAPAASELPQLTEDFTSTQHGYTIKYPPHWTVMAATKPWPFGSEGDHADDATADTFRSPSSSGLVVSSQALPAGMTEDKWFAAYLTGTSPLHPECNPARAQWEPITIAGVDAGVHGGLQGCSFTEAVAVVAGRAYVFTAYPNLDAPSGVIFNRALLDALLATVVFQPENAK
jgi:hypothetical protein